MRGAAVASDTKDAIVQVHVVTSTVRGGAVTPSRIGTGMGSVKKKRAKKISKHKRRKQLKAMRHKNK